MGTQNGISVEVEGLGGASRTVSVRFSVRRESGSLTAHADLDASAPLRVCGMVTDRTVGMGDERSVVDMAARELIGIVEPAAQHVAPLEAALAEARASSDTSRIEAMEWALEQAVGRVPSPAVA